MSQENSENRKESPRERFQKNNEPSNKKRNKALLFIPALVILTLAGIFVISILFEKTDDHLSAVPTDMTDITYPVDRFADGRAQHFNYTTADGLTIRYFVVKGKDGVIRTAFDACDACWAANKGYSQDGNHMVCRNCGQKFAVEKVGRQRGGCNPAPLTGRETDNNVVIRVTDILEGKRYFDFSKGGLK